MTSKRTWWERFKASSAHTQANIVCTILVMLATIGYAIIAARQLVSMNGQLSEVSKQFPEIQKSAAAAKLAADTAANTLTLSEANYRRDERAWVVVDQMSIIESYPGDDKFPASWKYGLYVRNVGKTIARDVRIHIDKAFGTGELSKHGVYLFQMRAFKGMHGKPFSPDARGPESLAPGERSAIPVLTSGSAPQRFPGSSAVGIDNIIGRIDYIDAFNVRHWRTFCYYAFDEKGDLIHCLSGNDQDQNPEPAVSSVSH